MFSYHGSLFRFSCISLIVIYFITKFNNQVQDVEAEIVENDNITDFPQFSIACINCNSLNMATVVKNIRMPKFYGIVSLKTDLIFVSDIRLCNKSGVGDFAFAKKIFATNPYRSYTFIHNSRTNCRGVGILYRLHTAILNRPLSNAATKEV